MIKGFLLKRLVMTQQYNQKGVLMAATVCRATPCFVVGLRSKAKDGYSAVQLASGNKKGINKPLQGQIKKSGLDFNPEIIREFILDDEGDAPKLGEKITIDKVFSPGDLISVRGVTKGRGFSGVLKRWNFHSQPATRGQKDTKRAPGSIGPQTPGRVIKGKKMPGHYGNAFRTIKRLEIISVDQEKGEVLIKGAVPGFRNAWLVAILTGKAKNFIPLVEKKLVKESEDKEN